MTPAEILKAPMAERQPTRTMDQLRADDAQLRMLAAPTVELKLWWAARMALLRGKTQ